MNSFFPHGISSWNIIISHFENLPPLDSLKKHIWSLFRPKKRSIFGIHDPIGLRNLLQLRVGLSPLRSHKKQHNFADTRSDNCLCKEGIEGTRHFLHFCPYYVIQRATLIHTVNEILTRNNLPPFENQTQLLLYGHDSLKEADNKKILVATLKFLKDTHRFSTRSCLLLVR